MIGSYQWSVVAMMSGQKYSIIVYRFSKPIQNAFIERNNDLLR